MSATVILGIVAGLGWGVAFGLAAALWFSHSAYRDQRGRA